MGVKSNIQDIAGQRFGKLTAVKPTTERYHGHILWLCDCDCGGTKLATVTHLRRAQNKSCGCLLVESGKKRSADKGLRYKDISGKFWADLRGSAKKRNIQLLLTMEEAWALWIQQNKCCALSGLPLYLRQSNKLLGTASLDRIDSSKAYTKDNVQWVHKEVNLMKQDLTQAEFLAWCTRIAEHALSK